VAIVVSWCLGGVVVWWRGCGDEAVLDPVVIVSWWCGGEAVSDPMVMVSWYHGGVETASLEEAWSVGLIAWRSCLLR